MSEKVKRKELCKHPNIVQKQGCGWATAECPDCESWNVIGCYPDTVDLERRLAEMTRLWNENLARLAESERLCQFWIHEHDNARSDAASLVKDLDEEIAALRQQLEGAQKDAARYRWLRDKGVSDEIPGRDCLLVYQGPDSDHSLLPDELDAAIDAALEKGND